MTFASVVGYKNEDTSISASALFVGTNQLDPENHTLAESTIGSTPVKDIPHIIRQMPNIAFQYQSLVITFYEDQREVNHLTWKSIASE